MSKSLVQNQIEKKDYNIKLAFFDIDGTLLDPGGQYSCILKDQIERIQNKGIKTAIASGRPHNAAKYLVEELGLKDAGLFCTGAHIYNPSTNQTVLVQPLDEELSFKLLHRVRQEGVYCELYTEEHFYIENNDSPQILSVHISHLRQQPELMAFDQIIRTNPLLKFLVCVDNVEDQQKLYQLESYFPELIFAYAGLVAHPGWLFASIVDASACKERMFDHLLEFHQVRADQVISFGDSHSDMIFLKRAGVGVAMGNASDEVKQVADFTTKTAGDDGVAFALSRFI